MQILKQIQVPYSFAKRHGVLFRYDGDQVFIIRRQNTEKLHCRKQDASWVSQLIINYVLNKNLIRS